MAGNKIPRLMVGSSTPWDGISMNSNHDSTGMQGDPGHEAEGQMFRAGSRPNLRYGSDDSLDYDPDPNRRKNNSRKQEGQPASSRQPLNTGVRKKGDLSKVQAGTLVGPTENAEPRPVWCFFHHRDTHSSGVCDQTRGAKRVVSPVHLGWPKPDKVASDQIVNTNPAAKTMSEVMDHIWQVNKLVQTYDEYVSKRDNMFAKIQENLLSSASPALADIWLELTAESNKTAEKLFKRLALWVEDSAASIVIAPISLYMMTDPKIRKEAPYTPDEVYAYFEGLEPEQRPVADSRQILKYLWQIRGIAEDYNSDTRTISKLSLGILHGHQQEMDKQRHLGLGFRTIMQVLPKVCGVRQREDFGFHIFCLMDLVPFLEDYNQALRARNRDST
jgi:hypothetical protein